MGCFWGTSLKKVHGKAQFEKECFRNLDSHFYSSEIETSLRENISDTKERGSAVYGVIQIEQVISMNMISINAIPWDATLLMNIAKQK